jgi:hypothetical protein
MGGVQTEVSEQRKRMAGEILNVVIQIGTQAHNTNTPAGRAKADPHRLDALPAGQNLPQAIGHMATLQIDQRAEFG